MLLIYKVPTLRFVEEHHLGLSPTLILVVLSALRAHSGRELGTTSAYCLGQHMWLHSFTAKNGFVFTPA